MTGDGFTDVIALTPDGDMWLYSNNIVRDNGRPYSSDASRQIGNGWNGFDRIMAADVTGDGYADVIALTPDGDMWLYSNNIVRDNGRPYSSDASRQIGNGWNGFNRIFPADVTGDGYADAVALTPGGDMWLYSNNIVRDNGRPYSSDASRQIGNGWDGFDRFLF